MYSAAVKNSYKVKRRSKFNYSKYITIFLILTTIIFFAIHTQGSKPIEYKTVVIEKGDTLWSIVKKYQSDEQDPRKMIAQIKSINNLDGAVLQPGQTIKIPEL